MNGIVVIDKPQGWTSHDVIAKLRGVFRQKRIGHAGTLDPMATGVLPVFLGRATRAVEFCEGDDKEYVAALRLGLTTDTQDITGNVLTSPGDPCFTESILMAVLRHFTGDIQQIPPMYSAIKKDGLKLYTLARRGVEVERTPRTVTIRELQLVGRRGNDFLLRVVCSKGTYIRTLCHDIGAYMGCGGVLTELRRTRSGRFTADQAFTMEQVADIAAAGRVEAVLTPVDQLFFVYPAVTADAVAERACRNGSTFAADVADGTYRVYNEQGAFLALGKCAGGRMETVKSFFEVEP